MPPETLVSFVPMEAIGTNGSLRLDNVRRLGDVIDGYSYFEDGDLLIAKITPCFENGKGALVSSLRDGIGFGTTEVTVVRPDNRKIYAPFLKWVFDSSDFRQCGEAAMYGAAGQKRVPDIFVKDYRIKLPSYPEQLEIAHFLNEAIAGIDGVLRQQEDLTALLREKRVAVISEIVLRGLDRYCTMKCSGHDWLGSIPAHWNLIPLMRLTDPERPIMYGIVLPGPDMMVGVPIVKGGNVKPERLCLDCLARTTPEIEAPFARARLRKDDLVYSIRGSIGDCELVPEQLEGSNITQDVARIAPDSDVDAEWLRYALLSAPVRAALQRRSLGAAVQGINIFDLKRVRIPTPPAQEMRLISTAIRVALEELDGLMLEAERVAKLLRERRAALIAAAVTGQINVEAQARKLAEAA